MNGLINAKRRKSHYPGVSVQDPSIEWDNANVWMGIQLKRISLKPAHEVSVIESSTYA
jgi:hypothetical protein